MSSLDKWSVIGAAFAFIYCILTLGLIGPELMAQYLSNSGACEMLQGLS